MRQYLEQKRLVFPRFYFLADQDVLEILANAGSRPEATLAPHIKKLFSGVDKLEIKGTGAERFNIIAFSSSEGETIRMFQPVLIES